MSSLFTKVRQTPSLSACPPSANDYIYVACSYIVSVSCVYGLSCKTVLKTTFRRNQEACEPVKKRKWLQVKFLFGFMSWDACTWWTITAVVSELDKGVWKDRQGGFLFLWETQTGRKKKAQRTDSRGGALIHLTQELLFYSPLLALSCLSVLQTSVTLKHQTGSNRKTSKTVLREHSALCKHWNESNLKLSFDLTFDPNLEIFIHEKNNKKPV